MKRIFLLLAMAVAWLSIDYIAVADELVTPSWKAEDAFSFNAVSNTQSVDTMDPQAVAREIRKFKRQHEAAISTPAATRERELSATAFEDLGPSGAINLATEVFEDPLETITDLPTDSLLASESTPVFVGGSETSVRIDPPGPDNSQLVVSDTPLKNDDGEIPSGEIEPAAGGFAPVTPLAEVQLPGTSVGEVSFDEAGVSFSFDEANGTNGRLVDVGDGSGDEMVIYPNTQTDTDTAITYTLLGIETFSYLRSADSPESIDLAYTLPDGASIVLNEDGSAAVIDSDGQILVDVFAPVATDAQGSNVPVSLSLEGNVLTLEVPHQGKDFAYPIMVDPIMHSRDWNTIGATGYDAWSFYEELTTNYNNSLTCPPSIAASDPCGTGTGAGVYVSGVPGSSYPAGSKGYWRWVAPGGAQSYIPSANFYGWRYRMGANVNGFGFFNIYNGGATNLNATHNGTSTTHYGPASNDSKWIHVGLMTQTANSFPTGSSNWRYMRLSNFTANLDDKDVPGISLWDGPSNWMGPNTTFTTKASATDNGLGLVAITANEGGSGTYKWFGMSGSSVCTGTYPTTCPSSTGTQTFSFNTNSFPSGRQSVPVTAHDMLLKSTTASFDAKVDKTAPTFATSGSLLDTRKPGGEFIVSVRDNTLASPVYNSNGDLNMTVPVGDYSKLGSGAKSVKLTVDGTQVGSAERPACAGVNGSCRIVPLQLDVDLNAFSEGSHTLVLSGKDQVGNDATPITWTKVIDRTAPTVTNPGATSSWVTGNATDLHFQAADSGYGVQKVIAKVDGAEIGSKNFNCGTPSTSTCSTSVTDFMPLNLTTLADGANEVSITAVDPQGHVSTPITKTIYVDRESVDVEAVDVPEWIAEDGLFQIDATNAGSGIESAILTANGVEVAEVENDCTNGCPVEIVGSTPVDASSLVGSTNGAIDLEVVVTAPVASRSTTIERDAKFDRTNPTGTISGPLFQSATVPFGAANQVEIVGTDLGGGLDSVEVLLDDQHAYATDADAIEGFEPVCSGGTCSFDVEFESAIAGSWEPGTYDLTVRALDAAGNSFSRSEEVEIDPALPEISITGELVDAEGHLPPSGVSELEVHALDTLNADDTGVNRVVLKVDDNVVASSCTPPNCVATSDEVVIPYEFDKSEWGTAPYQVLAEVTDDAGNFATATLEVDPPSTMPDDPECESIGSSYTGSSASNPTATLAGIDSISSEVLEETEPLTDEGMTSSPELEQTSSGSSPTYDIVGTLDAGSVNQDGAGVIDLGSGICVSPTNWNENSATTEVSDDALLSENSRPGTSTFVQAGFSGASIVEYVQSSSALSGIGWKPELGVNQQAQVLPSGDVAIVDTTAQAPDSMLEQVEGSSQPSDSEVVESLASTETQADVTDQKMLDAIMNTTNQVDAVLSKPAALDANGNAVPVTVNVSSTGAVTYQVPVTTTYPVLLVIQGFKTPDPKALCEDAFALNPTARAEMCGPISDEVLPEPEVIQTTPSYDLLGLEDVNEDAEEAQLFRAAMNWDQPTALREHIPSRREAQICGIVGAKVCALWAFDSREAINKRQYLFSNADGYGADNTMANAFQHGYWTAIMAHTAWVKDKNIWWALQFALAYEQGGETSTDPATRKSAKMDIINDMVGWVIAKRNISRTETGLCTLNFYRSWYAKFIGNREPKAIDRETMVYRRERSDNGHGKLVRPYGNRKCGD